jgi:flagellar motor switch protein FliN/FliY
VNTNPTLTTQQAAADVLVANLPNSASLRAVVTASPVPVPVAAATAITATFVGSLSVEFALVLLDWGFIHEVAGAQPRVRATDVVLPALELSAATFGIGVLGEAIEADASDLFSHSESVVFELVSEAGTAGWFIVRLRADQQAAGDPYRSIEGRLSRINEVEMALTVEIGRTRMPVRTVLGLEVGAVVELDRAVGAPADVLLNGRLIAHGEVVVVDQEFAVRITRILDGLEAAAR